MTTIYDILEQSVSLGVKNDFRGEDTKDFVWSETIDSGDGRSFTNFYQDTGVVAVDSLLKKVKTVVVGIDIGTSEIVALTMWAKSIGKTIDLFIGHHPEGRLKAIFPTIIYSHAGNLSAIGVDVSPIHDAYETLVQDLTIKNLSHNFTQIHDTVTHLGTDYICLHTPIDNMGAQFTLRKIQELKPITLEDTVKALLSIEEIAYYRGVNNIMPIIASGQKESLLGNFTTTEFTGGEEGPVEAYIEMKLQGIDTIICMHISEEGLSKCREIELNVIVTGHMNADSIGLNLFCDTLGDDIEVIPVSGFVRVKR